MHNSKIVKVPQSHKYRGSCPKNAPKPDNDDFANAGYEREPKYDKSVRKVRRFIDDIAYIDSKKHLPVFMHGPIVSIEIED